MTDASGLTTYNYDNMDRLSSKVTPEGTLSYTYDAAGNLASIASSNANGDEITHTGTAPKIIFIAAISGPPTSVSIICAPDRTARSPAG